MSQPSITSFYKAKKRPIQSPDDRPKPNKLLANESNRVQFVKKGNLSPVKRKDGAQLVNLDVVKAKKIAKNFSANFESLQKLQALKAQIEEKEKALAKKLLEKQNKKDEQVVVAEPESLQPKEVLPVDDLLDQDAKENEEELAKPVKPESKPRESSVATLSAKAPVIQYQVDPNPNLKLPPHLKTLKLLHDGMNSVASMFQARSEAITFAKLKPAVESMTKHTFTIKWIARMLTIDDSIIRVNVEKVDNANQYVIDYKIKLLPSQLVRLKKTFESRLLNYCLAEHERFLEGIGVHVERQLVTRWHPEFDIDSIQIPLAKLPDLKEKISSAAEILSQVRSMVLPKMKTPPCSPVKKPIPVKELKGISSSLLEKIRARERSKVIKDLTTPLAEIKLKKMKARLPEMTRIIHNLFVGEKKAAIEVPRFLERLEFSYGKLSACEVQEHVDFLLKNYPQWIQKIKSTSADYIKIDRNVQINSLTF